MHDTALTASCTRSLLIFFPAWQHMASYFSLTTFCSLSQAGEWKDGLMVWYTWFRLCVTWGRPIASPALNSQLEQCLAEVFVARIKNT